MKKFEKTQKIAGFDLDSVFDTWNSNLKYRYIDYKGDNGDVHMPQSYNQVTNSVIQEHMHTKNKSFKNMLYKKL
ncbi:hypothetical protein ACN2CX_09430 [Aliarcobacter butzleri]|uniref:hypothetical protein n=1 Tax=Aliarcobacter butzleri TaxID=28197 RepID=UPI003AFB162B